MFENDIITAKQVAEYLRLNVLTIYDMARSGAIPAFKVGYHWRFRKSMIDKWLATKM